MSSLSTTAPPAHPADPTRADINTLTVALYATGAYRRRILTDTEFDRYVTQGTQRLGTSTVTALARRLNALESAWAHGSLTDEDYTELRRAILPNLDRLERCYEHALGPPQT